MSTRLGPGYWLYDPLLRPAICAYLMRANNPTSPEMTEGQISAMRTYLGKWIACPMWEGEAIEYLRRTVDALTSRDAFDAWIGKAMDQGIDPL